VVAARAANKMNFGIALIPEGLVEFIPEIKVLIAELNDIFAHIDSAVAEADAAAKVAFAESKLTA
jgi:pyrophosphate--fructose-6-phosphate 1-phosphotransferase